MVARGRQHPLRVNVTRYNCAAAELGDGGSSMDVVSAACANVHRWARSRGFRDNSYLFFFARTTFRHFASQGMVSSVVGQQVTGAGL